MKTASLLSLASAFALSALGAEAFAASHVGRWTPNGHPICTAPGSQYRPQVVADGAGGCIVVWLDDRFGVGGDVFATRLDRDGNRVAGWVADGNRITAQSGIGTFPLAAASDGAAGAWIAWQQGQVGGGFALQLQHVLADGTTAPGWPAGGRRLIPTGSQGSFAMDDDGAGGVVLAWDGSEGGKAIRLTPEGDVAAGWPAGGVTPRVGATPFDIASGANEIVFVSTYESGTGPTPQLQVTLVRTDGTLIDQHVSGSHGNMRADFAIEKDGFGGVVGAMGLVDFMTCVRYDEGGNLIWGLSPATGAGVFMPAPELVDDGSGGAYYVFKYRYEELLCLRVDATGVVPAGWPAGGRIVSNVGGPLPARVARDGSGGVLIAWSNNLTDVADALYAVRLTGGGSVAAGWTPEGDIVSDGPGTQELSDMTDTEPGSAVVVWTDSRSGENDIYAQRLSADSPTPVAVALVEARVEAGRVGLWWHASDAAMVTAAVERRTESTPWTRVAEVVADGMGAIRYEDAAVVAGGRYGYRLVIRSDGVDEAVGETWVTVPGAAAVALSRASSSGAVLDATLPQGESGRIDLLDLAGRRVASRPLSGGVQRVDFGASLAPGVYLARAQCPSGAARLKVCVVR